MAINYIMIGSNDLDRARIFYDAVMPHLGATLAHDYPGMTFAYAVGGGQHVWIVRPYDKQAATLGNGSMPGFGCATKEAVDAAHAAALAHGGTNEGETGPRPQYGPGVYLGYVRDPDGNKMSFLHSDAGAA